MICRRCKQVVLKAIMESGRKVTLDPLPARDGTMRISIYLGKGSRPVVFTASIVPPYRLKQYPGELYRAHACKEKPCRKP
jgi:hypothetical protein